MKNALINRPIFSRNPWRTFSKMEDEMERWFADSLSAIPAGYDFTPSVEMDENEQNYTFKFDVPGMNKNDMKIEVDSNRLTVSGERREEKEKTSGKRRYSESTYGTFMRSFTLPQTLEEKSVNAKYENGVLTVIVKKSPKSDTKTVAIQ
jgi:HSP20 family protein